MDEPLAKVVWVRYTWKLPGLDPRVLPPAGYNFRRALGDELGAVTQVVMAAYASDPAWGRLLHGVGERMTERIRTTIDTPDSQYLVAESGRHIVAVSGIAKEHSTEQNLLTGVCVAPVHQQRGLGRYLLALSLLRLREMGLEIAKVYTEAGSLADRKIYPLFGSRREEGVRYPGLQPRAFGKARIQ